MVVRIEMAPRLMGMTPMQTLEHWQSSAAIAARRIPQVSSYVQNHPLLEHGRYLAPYPGFDICNEIEFESLEAMHDALDSVVYREEVGPDEDEFIQRSLSSIVVGERDSVLSGWSPVAGAKRMWFLRTHPARAADDLVATATGPMFKALSAARIARFDVISAEPGFHKGHTPAAFDVVIVAWFSDPSLVISLAESPAFDAAEASIAGLYSGRADWLCVPYRIK